MCDTGSSCSSSLSILLVDEFDLERILGFSEFLDLISVNFFSLYKMFGEVRSDGDNVLEDTGTGLLEVSCLKVESVEFLS